MRMLIAIVVVAFGSCVRGGVLGGPIVNPGNGHVYYLLSQNTWSNAETEAVSLGGHLATIRNAAEDSWVYSTFCGYGGALWIGLTDREGPSQFVWMSGDPVSYTNLSFTSERDKLYQVEWTPSLSAPHWEAVGLAQKGTGASLSVLVSTRERRQGFYRVEVVQ